MSLCRSRLVSQDLVSQHYECCRWRQVSFFIEEFPISTAMMMDNTNDGGRDDCLIESS